MEIIKESAPNKIPARFNNLSVFNDKGISEDDQNLVSELFNEFFINVGTRPGGNDDSCAGGAVYSVPLVQKTMFLSPTDVSVKFAEE